MTDESVVQQFSFGVTFLETVYTRYETGQARKSTSVCGEDRWPHHLDIAIEKTLHRVSRSILAMRLTSQACAFFSLGNPYCGLCAALH